MQNYQLKLLITILIITFCITYATYGFAIESSLNLSNNNVVRSEAKQTEGMYSGYYGRLRKEFRIEDELISKLAAEPPRSSWFESEKAFYKEQLVNNCYDVLVVPFQTQDYGLDHVGRMLLSYKLAVAIEQNTDLKVAPLIFIYPALGGGQRYYNENEVYDLARQIGIKRIIWGYAGTQNVLNRIKLSYTIIDEKFPFSESTNKKVCKKWSGITMQPYRIPFKVFSSNLDSVMKFLNFPFKKQAETYISNEKANYTVPSSPKELLSKDNKDTILLSYYIQLLAMLAPTDYQKTYLFTRSVINLFQLETSNPDRRLIEARAFLHLYRRPAALSEIEGVTSKEIEAFRHYANGNLTDLEENISSIKPSIKRFLAELELYSLRNEFGKKMTEHEISEYVKRYKHWSYFLRKRLAHYDRWERASNINLKKILDEYFPVPGFSFDDVLSGMAVTERNYGDLSFELLFQDHIHKAILHRNKSITNMSNSSGSAIDFDFLMMAESMGWHNLIRMISLPGSTQWMPETGLKICNDILNTYKDHPYFTCLKLTMLYNLIEGRSEIVKANIRQSIYELSVNTMWWNGRQNWVNRTARRFLSYINQANDKIIQPNPFFISEKDLTRCIGMDYPFRVNNVKNTIYRSRESILPWVHTEIQEFIGQYYSLPIRFREHGNLADSEYCSAPYVLSEINSRFNGHPEKIRFLISQEMKKNKKADKKKLLLSQIQTGASEWKTYKELAEQYIGELSYDKAKEILLSYPGLVPPFDDNVVVSSNIASTAGNMFFKIGEIDHALKFYEVCSMLNTGSAMCLKGQERYALLNKDYTSAIQLSLARGKRYNDPSAFANYMNYLHLLGEHEQAWSIFKNMIIHYDPTHEIWTPAFIGLRMEGKSDREIIEWMNGMLKVAKTEKQKSYLARFGSLCLTDRIPNAEIISKVKQNDLPVMLSYYRTKVRLSASSKSDHLPYTAFSKGYESLLNKQYNDAYQFLSRINTNRPDGYIAYSAVKSGNIDKYKRKYYSNTKRNKNPTYHDFNKLIAFAVLDCYSKKHHEAVLDLKTAFSLRPLTIDDPYYNMYYLMEICELLYIDTLEPLYLDLLLKWCHVYQSVAPMFAWPYAFEAKYATNEYDKLRSLAIAQYLDPRSLRISGIDKETKKKATKWFELNNPFTNHVNNRKGV